jgi:hypothetical protein
MMASADFLSKQNKGLLEQSFRQGSKSLTEAISIYTQSGNIDDVRDLLK